MKVHIHASTLKVVLTNVLSRYKGPFSADRQKTDNEKDPTICQTICHNANDPGFYSVGPSLKSHPLHRFLKRFIAQKIHRNTQVYKIIPLTNLP
jgi:hypothetical protein